MPAEATGPTEVSEPPENEPVIDGEVVSEDERAARELAQQKERTAAEHLPLSPYYQEQLRLQLADHAEREHQMRLVRNGDDEKVPEPLGPGGGITAEVVQAMAKAIAEKQLPGPDGSPEHRELLLFGALAAAGLNRAEARVSFVTSRGRLMLDVSTADQDESEPSLRLVRLSRRPQGADEDMADPADQDAAEPAEGRAEPAARDAAETADQGAAEPAARDAAEPADQCKADQDTADQDTADQGTADQCRADQDTADQDTADQGTAAQDTAEPPDGNDAAASDEDGEPGRYAAVLCGSAAKIAGGRAFLGMDALTEYARGKAFRVGNLADPEAASRRMLAAHRIEIVVLLDVSLGGGVWVDVNPKTGRPAATLRIDLEPAGFQFTPLAVA